MPYCRVSCSIRFRPSSGIEKETKYSAPSVGFPDSPLLLADQIIDKLAV
jgi:hypothetical protein